MSTFAVALGSTWLPGMCTAPRSSVVASPNGIAAVDRLVGEVMSQEPYKSARRVFWIMDNCSAHRGQRAADRCRTQWPNAILIHTPTHASWLNQVEIYFSIVQRKVLTPNDFSSLADLEQRLLAFQIHYERTASQLNGPSPTAICRRSWPSSTQNAWLPQPDRKYVTVILNQTTKLTRRPESRRTTRAGVYPTSRASSSESRQRCR